MKRYEGSAFRKADLHVHTPRSLCFSEDSVTPQQIVETALDKGLDIIAITDHNSVAAIDEILETAMNKDLFVFPGVELSTSGGHVVAIFDLDTSVSVLEDFLDYVGIERNGRGNAMTLAEGGMGDVCQKISERGGLAIAAHIERWPTGFLETNEPLRVKMRIHSNRNLKALEITIPQNKKLWNAGKVRGYPKKHACIQASDAHALADIGRRVVHIKMEEVGLAALRLAFIDYESHIVFPGECPPSR